MAQRGPGSDHAFDLQAHRGGLGLVVENTMAAFRNAAALGVTTLECDVHISADGVAMVTHDRVLDATKIRDTAPAQPGDSEYPYVGRFVSRLSSEQLATLDCGSLRHPDHPEQRLVPGEPMPRLEQVLELARSADLFVNVETKFEVVHPAETAPRERFIEVVRRLIEGAGMVDRVSVQSFDWTLLRLLRWQAPRIRRYALASERTLERGRPGPSPWLGGADIDEVVDLVAAADGLDLTGLSPDHRAVDAVLLAHAHDAGLVVLPYTVDDPARMDALIALGVDGFISNRPDRVREALRRSGRPLPPAHPDLVSPPAASAAGPGPPPRPPGRR